MALHTTPTDHDNDPPSAWSVVKKGERSWHLQSSLGGVIGYFTTRREAEEHRTGGRYVKLYEDEGRWFAGEQVRGWKPYEPAARG